MVELGEEIRAVSETVGSAVATVAGHTNPSVALHSGLFLRVLAAAIPGCAALLMHTELSLITSVHAELVTCKATEVAQVDNTIQYNTYIHTYIHTYIQHTRYILIYDGQQRKEI